MPRIRTVKPEFFTSPDTAKASPMARILYAAMWCWADDYGVGETNLNGLLGFAFPDEDPVDRGELEELLREVSAAYSVLFYRASGRAYYYIPSWSAHQKTEKRTKDAGPKPWMDGSAPDLRFNDAEWFAGEIQRHSSAGKGTGEGEREQGNIGKGKGSPRGTRLDPDWRPELHVWEEMAKECPCINLELEHKEFVDYWTDRTSDAMRVSWVGTWRNSMRKKQRWAQERLQKNGSRVDQNVNGWFNTFPQPRELA
jgi:hypothetical protein